MRTLNVPFAFLLAIGVSSTLFAPGPGVTQPRPQDPPARAQVKPRREVPPPQYSLQIPPAIRRDEILHYATILKLDDMQITALVVLYDEYREKEEQQRSELLAPLRERSIDLAADLAAHHKGLEAVAYYRALADLMQDSQLAATDLAKLDDELLGEIESIFLDEDQLPFLERVRQQRQRIRWNEFSGPYGMGQIDLTLLLSALPEQDTLGESARQELDQLLAEYDRDITPLSEKRYKAVVKANLEVPVLKAPFIVSQADIDPEGIEQLMVQYEEVLKKVARLNRAYIRPAKRIHTLNRRYLTSFVALLPTSAGVELQRRFREQAYRSIYPNLFDVSDLLRTSLEIESLTTEQRTIIDATLVTYTQRNHQACEKMERRYLTWREFLAEKLQKPRDEVDAYQADMRRLDNTRQEAAMNAIDLLKATLLPPQLQEIAQMMLETEQRFLIGEKDREFRLVHG